MNKEEGQMSRKRYIFICKAIVLSMTFFLLSGCGKDASENTNAEIEETREQEEMSETELKEEKVLDSEEEEDDIEDDFFEDK